MTYSLTDPSTLASIENWLALVNESIEEGIPIMLVGTKSD